MTCDCASYNVSLTITALTITALAITDLAITYSAIADLTIINLIMASLMIDDLEYFGLLRSLHAPIRATAQQVMPSQRAQ